MPIDAHALALSTHPVNANNIHPCVQFSPSLNKLQGIKLNWKGKVNHLPWHRPMNDNDNDNNSKT